MESLFTESQVARKLQVCKRTVERLRKSGQLRYLRVAGRVVRFTDEQVKEFITRQERGVG